MLQLRELIHSRSAWSESGHLACVPAPRQRVKRCLCPKVPINANQDSQASLGWTVRRAGEGSGWFSPIKTLGFAATLHVQHVEVKHGKTHQVNHQNTACNTLVGTRPDSVNPRVYERRPPWGKACGGPGGPEKTMGCFRTIVVSENSRFVLAVSVFTMI